jgi:DNA-binding MarR family transcriptional regulator
MNATEIKQLQTPPNACLPRELIASPIFLLGRLGISVKLEAMDEFEKEGFNAYDYGVLALLEEGVRETQAAIADALKVDRSQLVGLLDRLEDRGLVERRRDPNDRRRHVVSVTPAGTKELAKLRKIVERLEDEILEPLSCEERKQLHVLLHRVARHHDARFDPQPAA